MAVHPLHINTCRCTGAPRTDTTRGAGREQMHVLREAAPSALPIMPSSHRRSTHIDPSLERREKSTAIPTGVPRQRSGRKASVTLDASGTLGICSTYLTVPRAHGRHGCHWSQPCGPRGGWRLQGLRNRGGGGKRIQCLGLFCTGMACRYRKLMHSADPATKRGCVFAASVSASAPCPLLS